ncbi:MAG: hypothetical protein H8D05_00350 [FCB group bacterium]|nr:hypothetical protein [FCB group bacterium]
MGLAHNGDYLYIASEEEYICNYVEYCVSDSAEVYLPFGGVSGDIFDIAYDAGDIWLAWDNIDQPLQKFDETGLVVDFVTSSVIERAHGLTMDDSGYLWVSDMETDSIYMIQIVSSLQQTTWGNIKRANN